MIKQIACGFLACFIGFYVNGQKVVIDTITVTADALRSNNFGGSTTLLEYSGSVSQSLSENSAVFIKNYGPGSLATSSIRGGSASHTLVLWNDLPIQNSFLGLLDLSLIDTWAMNSVKLQKGGNSAMWGSGAIGGVISLDQKNSETAKMSFQNDFMVGSFGRMEERIKFAFKAKKLRSVSNLTVVKAENDFPYRLGNDIRKLQENAAQDQINIHQDIYWRIDQSNELAFHYWMSRSQRQIPPTTVQNQSDAHQNDKANRFSMQWKRLGRHHQTRLNAAYFTEDLDYFDPALEIESLTHSETFVVDVNDEVKMATHHVINFGTSIYRTEVSSPANYENAAKENRIAAFARYQYKWFQLSGRQEWVDEKWIPFTPSAAFEIPFKKHLTFKGKISRNYRLPTLNDRFWEPGGNPDLLPESGWSEEAVVSFKKSNLGLTLSGFNRIIDHWIQWALLDGDRTFSPYNLNQVWSRGLELDGHYNYKALNFNAGYLFVKSTNTKAVKIPKISKGDQLFYTPVHSGFASVKMNYKHWKLQYLQKYTGETLGLNGNLAPWTTGDFFADYSFNRIGIYANILNIWNANYRIIERRPMPGRHFEIGLRLKLEKE